MGARARDTSEWIVYGKKHSQPWLIVVFVVAIGVLVVLAYQRFMAFDTVTYELRVCRGTLTADSPWSEVESADCRPASFGDVEVVVYEGTSRHAPAAVDGAAYSFDRFPLNSTSHSVEIDRLPSADGVLIAEPTTEQIRRAMSGNAAGTAWSGFVGDRGPTLYWLLVTGGEAASTG